MAASAITSRHFNLPAMNQKTTFEGQIVRDATGIRGYGFFLLPKMPAAPGETLSNTAKISGQVLL